LVIHKLVYSRYRLSVLDTAYPIPLQTPVWLDLKDVPLWKDALEKLRFVRDVAREILFDAVKRGQLVLGKLIEALARAIHSTELLAFDISLSLEPTSTEVPTEKLSFPRALESKEWFFQGDHLSKQTSANSKESDLII
jgi:hypothetical protein